MAQYKGDSRDGKRARYGARVQEEMKEAFERKVQEMRAETNKSLNNMELGSMFSMDSSISQQKFTNATVGLQTHEQYKNKAKIYLNSNDNSKNEIINTKTDTNTDTITTKSNSPKQISTKKPITCLSFHDETESEFESEDEQTQSKPDEQKQIQSKLDEQTKIKKRKLENDGLINVSNKRRKILHKNPNVNTSFLHDKERDELDAKLRNELEIEWNNKQKLIKHERLEITYSYWDGSGHRRSIEITKGISIGAFLELVRKELSPHFSELRGISGGMLMYIKDDLIIPQSYLFYDLIVTNARGKSGHLMFKNQLYNKGDYVIDKDSGHPGKVITRSWYDRNKHIFPASRWELYDAQSTSETK